jgi:hypothetical protein
MCHAARITNATLLSVTQTKEAMPLIRLWDASRGTFRVDSLNFLQAIRHFGTR